MTVETSFVMGIEDEDEIECTPEQRLWLSIILFAYQDAGKTRRKCRTWMKFIKNKTGDPPGPLSVCRSPEHMFLRGIGEMERILSEVRHPYFQTICLNAGANYKAIREKFEEHFKEVVEFSRTPYVQKCHKALAGMVRKNAKKRPSSEGQ